MSKVSIDYAILGLLSWKSLTGYDIKKMFAGSDTLYWSGNNNQIYTSLAKLFKNGFVSKETELQGDSPPRKIYSITAEGQAALEEWLRTEPEFPQLKNPFLIQLAWADCLNSDELDALLTRYEEEAQNALLILQVQAEQNNVDLNGKPRDVYINPALGRTKREVVLWSMIQLNWIQFYQNELNWVRNLREQLQKQGLNNLE